MNATILIADDDEDVVDLLSRRCITLGLEVDTASNAMTALGKAEEHLPDVVILDIDMPYGNGLSVCEMMAAHDELCCIPVIILTGSKNEEIVRRCHELCAYYVLKSPDLWLRVEPVLQEILSASGQTIASMPSCPLSGHRDSAANPNLTTAEESLESEENSLTTEPVPTSQNRDDETMELSEPTNLMDTVFAILAAEEGDNLWEPDSSGDTERSDQPWVLSIEDDDDIALALKLRLQKIGIQVIRAEGGIGGYRKAFTEAPHAIILDYELPDGNGDYVLRRLKESPATCSIPVIVLTGRKESSIERQMRGLGASEFLTKPFDWNRLQAALNVSLDAKQVTRVNSTPEGVLSDG